MRIIKFSAALLIIPLLIVYGAYRLGLYPDDLRERAVSGLDLPSGEEYVPEDTAVTEYVLGEVSSLLSDASGFFVPAGK